jgi:hypothetical protein
MQSKKQKVQKKCLPVDWTLLDTSEQQPFNQTRIFFEGG